MSADGSRLSEAQARAALRGQIEEGNIDLHNRPVVKNPDGSISTVRSMSFQEEKGGPEILVPTIADDGRELSPKEAIKLYQQTGKHLGKFSDVDGATRYAVRLHEDQERQYGDQKLTEDQARQLLRGKSAWGSIGHSAKNLPAAVKFAGEQAVAKPVQTLTGTADLAVNLPSALLQSGEVQAAQDIERSTALFPGLAAEASGRTPEQASAQAAAVTSAAGDRAVGTLARQPVTDALRKIAPGVVDFTIEGAQRHADETRAAMRRNAEMAQALRPDGAAGVATDFGAAALQMAPAALTMLATRNPKLAASTIAGPVYGQATAEGIDKTGDVAAGTARGVAMFGAEMATEAPVIGLLFKPIKSVVKSGSVRSFGAALTRSLAPRIGAEAAQEFVTSLLQDGYDASALDEDMSFADVLERAGYSALIGGLVGGSYGFPASVAEARERIRGAGVNDATADVLSRAAGLRAGGQPLSSAVLSGAVDDAPDADLQATSPRYRKLREAASEKQAKDILRGELLSAIKFDSAAAGDNTAAARSGDVAGTEAADEAVPLLNDEQAEAQLFRDPAVPETDPSLGAQGSIDPSALVDKTDLSPSAPFTEDPTSAPPATADSLTASEEGQDEGATTTPNGTDSGRTFPARSSAIARGPEEGLEGMRGADPGAQAAPTGDGSVPAVRHADDQPADPLDAQAHRAATSPLNDLPEPTDAQKGAGNYRKGHVRAHGFDISIENPAGSRRRPEWDPLSDHYGYIRGTKGRDKEHIDTFVGPADDSPSAFVVDQIDPATGKFDEHKVMLGYRSLNEAREAYLRNYQPGWKGLGRITAVPKGKLKDWLSKPQTKPFAKPTKLTAHDDARLANPDTRNKLQWMAPEAGWSEIGGRMIRSGEGANQFAQDMGRGGQHGEVTGRTPWVPKAPWFQSVQRDAPLPNNNGGGATIQAVDKALAGQPLNAAEKRHVSAMLEWIDGEEAAWQAELENRRAFDQNLEAELDMATLAAVNAQAKANLGSDSTTEDLIDHAAVAVASEIDEEAVERAARQFENDDRAFMSAVRRILSGQSEGQGTSAGTDGDRAALPPAGRQASRAAGQQGQPAGAQEQARDEVTDDEIWEPRAEYRVTPQAPLTPIEGLRGLEQLDKLHRRALDKFLATREDGAQVQANLKKHRGTPWEKQAVEGILARIALEDLVAGRAPSVRSALDRPNVKSLREALERNGAEGAFQYLHRAGVIGNPEKPVNAVNSSFAKCNPSKDCAKYCYATKGHYVYAPSIVKAELITWAVETDSNRVGRMVANEYKATAEYEAKKALRLFDKGDGDKAWLPIIKQLNAHGIRTQIFSKNPAFLRQVPEFNLRMLSIDESNEAMADENPDLKVALVYSGREQLPFVEKHQGQIQVILPVKLGQRTLNGDEVDQLPKWARAYTCPIDAGVKKLGAWNCTKCDRFGGVGCFHGNVTASLLDRLQKGGFTDEELTNAIKLVADAAASGRLGADERARLLDQLDAVLRGTGAGAAGGEAGGAAGQAQVAGGRAGVVEHPVRFAGARRAAKDPAVGEERPGYVREQNDLFGAAPERSGVELERDRRERQQEAQRQRAPGPEGFRLTGSDRDTDVATAAGQQSLFPGVGKPGDTGPDQSAVRGNVQPAGPVPRYATETQVIEVGTRRLGKGVVRNAQDLADATAYLGDNAVEHLDAIVTDKDGKVLAVIGAFKGARDAASVYPHTILGEVYGLPGAAHVWLSHNHPSGVETLSGADRKLQEGLAGAFKGSRIEVRGVMAIGRDNATGERTYEYNDENGNRERGTARPSTGKTVPVMERTFKRTGLLHKQLGSPAEAKRAVMDIAGKTPGVVLLDNQHQPIAFVPMDPALAGKLRDTGGLDLIYEAVSVSNAGSAIIANPNSAYTRAQIENLGAGLQRGAGEVRVLDAIEYSTAPGSIATSYAERGWSAASDRFYSRSAPPAEFAPDAKEAGSFRAALEKGMRSMRTFIEPFTLGRTPAVLRALGAKDIPLTITRDVVRKATTGVKHDVPISAIEQLPEELSDPLMVFDSDTEKGALVVLTELKDASGRPVVVSVDLRATPGRYVVNRISSVYGKDQLSAVQRWLNGGRLRYQSERSPNWVRLSRLYMPGSGSPSQGVGQKVLTEADVVKGRYARGDRQGRSTVMKVRATLAERLGVDVIGPLEQAGKLRIVQSSRDLPGSPDGRVRGLYHRGTTWLVADHIAPENAAGVLLHETGVHEGEASLDTVLGKQFDRWVERFHVLKEKGGRRERELALEAERRAHAEMEARRREGLLVNDRILNSERVAHFVELLEGAPRKELFGARRWLEDVVAAIRQWILSLDRLPTPLRRAIADTITGTDFVRAARETVRQIAAGSTAVDGGVATMASAARPQPVFYSGMERTLESKLNATGTGEALAKQIEALNRNGAFKREELEWSGVLEWLRNKENVLRKIPRAEVLDYLGANRIQVQDVVKQAGPVVPQKDIDAAREWLVAKFGDPNEDLVFPDWRWEDAAAGDTRSVADLEGLGMPDNLLAPFREAAQGEHGPSYAAYQLPGGENYRELLLTLPSTDSRPTYEAVEQKLMDLGYVPYEDNGWLLQDPNGDDIDPEKAPPEVRRLFAQLQGSAERPATRTSFRSSHFDQENILAHVRFNERTDADGKRVLFIEEVQSDWHQKGRKVGYAEGKPMTPKEAIQMVAVAQGLTTDELVEKYGYANEQDYVTLATTQYASGPRGVPDAPFKTTWPMLAMRRMIRWAAEHGFDRIAWTTGEQQAERYDLSKSVDSILYRKNEDGTYAVSAVTDRGNRGNMLGDHASESELEGIVGKDVAKRIVDGAGDPIQTQSSKGGWRALTGGNLKIGGEGMIAFYDRELVNEVGKYVKKWGAKVVRTLIDAGGKYRYTYSGPTYTYKAIVAAMNIASKPGNVYENPLTGKRGDTVFTRVAVEQPLRKVQALMIGRNGLSFERAVETLGEEIAGSMVTEIFGGTLTAERIREDVSAHAVDVTPQMIDAALQGQPMFARTVPTTPALEAAMKKAGTLAPAKKRIVDRLLAGWQKIRGDMTVAEAVADRLRPLLDAERDAGVSPANNAYQLARLAGNSNTTIYATLSFGPPQFKADGVVEQRPGVPGLLDILLPLGEDVQDFLSWMVGKRAEWLSSAAGGRRENNLSQADIAELLALATGHQQQFEAAARQMKAFNTAMLEFARDGHLLSQDQVDAFTKEDYYVPFYRVDPNADDAATMPFTKRSLSHQDAGIKRLKGGTEELNDPLENLMANVARLVDASMKNRALHRAIINLPALMTQATGSKEKAVRVMYRGKPYWFDVTDPALHRALRGVTDGPKNELWRRVGRTFRSVLTTGVTAEPTFMIRNFMRDALHAWTIDKNGFGLATDSLRGAKESLKEVFGPNADPAVRELMFAGASFMGGHISGLDPAARAEGMRKALRRKGMTPAQTSAYMKSLTKVGDLWDRYRQIGDAIENANRVAVYKAAIAKGKSQKEAAFEGLDLMDYNLRGSAATMQALTDTVPFLNARIQGLYKLGREMRRDPKVLKAFSKQVASKGALLALASIALAMHNEDDERYQQLPDWDKDANWHIFGPRGEGVEEGIHIRIPKPFEIGVLFGTVPERMFRSLIGADDLSTTGKSAARAMVSTFAFNPIPQAVKPAIESFFNFDTFRWAPIEGQGDERKLPEDRFGAYTSRTMVELGQALGVSPKKLEYLWRGYLGTLGTYVLGMSDKVADLATGVEAPTRRIGDYPILGSFVKSGPARSTQYMEDLYRLSKEADQVAASIKAAPDPERAKSLVEDNRELLGRQKTLTSAKEAISDMRKERDALLLDKKRTGDEKRAKLDRIQQEMNRIAEAAARVD